MTQPNMHQRLEEMRTQIYRRRNAAPHSDLETYPDQISLCEGGCLLRPHPNFFTAILDMFTDYLEQPLQIYPQNNMYQPMLDLIAKYHREVCKLPEELATSILFGMGSSQILEAMLAVVKKPDGIVLMPTSCYHAFVDWPLKWGMRSVLVPTSSVDQYKLTGPALREWIKANPLLRSRISLLLLANPTTAGAVYTSQELEQLAGVVSEYELPVFMDEVYRGTEYGETSTLSLASYPYMDKWVVTANSPSKAWQAANLRAGWAAVPLHWRQSMQKIINNSVTEMPFLLQAGLYGALSSPREYLDIFRNELAVRAAFCKKEIINLNERLNDHYGTQGETYLSLPFETSAGHFVVVNFDRFAGALTKEEIKIHSPLMLGSYLLDYHEEKKPAGLALSAGYSKGHDDYTFYISFAQLGFEVMSEASQPVELAYMLKNIVNKAKNVSQFSNMKILTENIDIPNFDPDPGLKRGKDILKESFRRLECALKDLKPML